KKEEARLKAKADEDEALKSARGAWLRVADAQKVRAANIRKYTLLEGGAGFNSELFGIARTLLRSGDELAKSNADRLREFNESNLDSLKHQLYSEEPIYPEYEIVKLADGLTFLAGELGYRDPLVQKVLAGKSPQARARELVEGTKLKDVGVRKKLFGSKEGLGASKDS